MVVSQSVESSLEVRVALFEERHVEGALLELAAKLGAHRTL